MKKTLEEIYDLPFNVQKKPNEYIIYPENEMDELFEIRIQYRSEVRIIVEAYPQKHAAAMLDDMARADEGKKNRFLAYKQLFNKKHAKVAIEVNGLEVEDGKWPENWKNLRVRVTKIEEQDIDFDEIAKEWAVCACGMMLSLLNVEQIEKLEGKLEGRKIEIHMSRYERNPINRELCIELNGVTCQICGFNFEQIYGDIGKRFIHIHHIKPISTMGGEYIPNPRTDLIPVCPNCHAMLHRSEPPLMPERLIEILKERNGKIEK